MRRSLQFARCGGPTRTRVTRWIESLRDLLLTFEVRSRCPGLNRGPTVYEGPSDVRTDEDHRDTTNDGNENEVDRRESSRIDGKARAAFADRISLAIVNAQARWIEERDCVELRRALLAVLLSLEEV